MEAKSNEAYKEQVYRSYMAAAVKSISENVANGIGGKGASYMARSYSEILYPPKEPEHTADEIIDNMKRKLKGYE